MASVETASPATADACKRSQILEGAARVFACNGYEGASMSRIALEAGVSKGTLYNYFPGKAELFAAYMHGMCTRWIVLAFDELDRDTPPADVLHHIGRRMTSMLLSDAGLVIYRMVVAEAEKFPELAQAFYAEGPARGMSHLSAYLRRSTEAGRLRVTDCEFAAEQFFALIQTKLSMQRRLHLIAMPSEAQIEQVVTRAVDLFMRGYGVPEPHEAAR